MTQIAFRFGGTTFDPDQDSERLSRQFLRVRALMLDGEWRSLYTIADATGDPVQSISARLRDLRKAKFGGYNVERRRVAGGLWEYRVFSGDCGRNNGDSSGAGGV